jgi:AcrR family transcriptional regulator
MVNAKKYLTHRQRQALATQKLIVDSARDLFLEQGYGNTTIEAISARAGVAVSTVYAVFGSKRGILRAIREAWHQESQQRDIYHEARQQSDPRHRLELAARATRHQWETGAAMLTIYRGAAATDQEAAAELKEALRGRRAALDRFISEMSPALRSGLSPDRAAAIFFALTLPEIYENLVSEAGWLPDQYEAWLAEILLQQLLP